MFALDREKYCFALPVNMMKSCYYFIEQRQMPGKKIDKIILVEPTGKNIRVKFAILKWL